MNREEATLLTQGLVLEERLRQAKGRVSTLMVEARFYLSPEWSEYRDQVLEPRYREASDALAMADDTASMLRLQGEARALRYQIDRSTAVTADLEKAKDDLTKQEQSLRAAAGIRANG